MLSARQTPTVTALLLGVVLVATPSAIGASDHDQPMPYRDYVALVQAWDGGITEWSPEPTMERVVADMEAAILRGEERVALLQSITPEACYAAAHEELIAYHREAVIELSGLQRVVETAPTTAELVTEITTADARLVGRHPTAFVEPDEPTGAIGTRKRLDLPNVLRRLATCDLDGHTAPPSESSVFAPDDLAALVPSRVGPVSLVIETDEDRDPTAAIETSRFFERFDRSPKDLTGALGSGQTPDGRVVLGIFVLRVAGIPAEQLYEPLLLLFGLDAAALSQTWVEEDDRRYMQIGPDAAGGHIVVYPKGEVLFLGFALGITPGEVMATLP